MECFLILFNSTECIRSKCSRYMNDWVYTVLTIRCIAKNIGMCALLCSAVSSDLFMFKVPSEFHTWILLDERITAR
jgi:hypothetical protein